MHTDPFESTDLIDEFTNGKPRVLMPVVVGTRPEAIKLVPVIMRMNQSSVVKPIVVSTGQHHNMVEEIFEAAEIGTQVHLWAGADRAALTERVATVMQRFNDFCLEWFGPRPADEQLNDTILAGKYPAAVIVHGDTSSAMSAALSAFHLRIPVCHVEAGLRTGGSILSPFPEELNRQVITCIAAMNFAPTFKNLENLTRENVPVGQVFVTGNTGIDALRWAATIASPYVDRELERLDTSGAKIVVVTAHRRENWGEGLAGIAEGVKRLAAEFTDHTFVVPLHPNPLVQKQLGDPLREIDNIHLTEPLDYTEFARLLGRCELVLTDSGGIQEEAPSLGKPVLVMRETTERGEGVEAGTLKLVGTDPDKIYKSAAKLLSDQVAYAEMADSDNPYGDGYAAERIVMALEYMVTGEKPPLPFSSGFSRQEVAAAGGIELRNPSSGHAVDVIDAMLRDAPEPSERESWPL